MPPDIMTTVVGIALGALIALNAWTVRTLLEVKVTLVGIDGQNGINSRVRRLEKAVYHEV